MLEIKNLCASVGNNQILRGIGSEDAGSLLTYAFASDIVSRMKVEPIRARLDESLLSQLRKAI